MQDASWVVERMERKKAAFLEMIVQVDSINTLRGKIENLEGHCIIRDG